MRVTDRHQFDTASQRIARLESSVQSDVDQLSSGRGVNRPSDNPLRYELGRVAAAQRESLAAYSLSAEQAMGALAQVDQTLAGMQSSLQRLLELTVQGASEQFSQSERDAMALEVEALRQVLISQANTKIGDRYLLGGTRDDTPPFAQDGSFQGSSEEVLVEVAPGLRAATRLNGDRLLSSAGNNVFGLASQISQALAAGDTSTLSNLVPGVQQAVRDLATAQAEVGSHDALASQAHAILQADDVQNEIRNDTAIGTDVAVVTSRLALTMRSLDALQQVVERTLSRGLLDL